MAEDPNPGRPGQGLEEGPELIEMPEGTETLTVPADSAATDLAPGRAPIGTLLELEGTAAWLRWSVWGLAVFSVASISFAFITSWGHGPGEVGLQAILFPSLGGVLLAVISIPGGRTLRRGRRKYANDVRVQRIRAPRHAVAILLAISLADFGMLWVGDAVIPARDSLNIKVYNEMDHSAVVRIDLIQADPPHSTYSFTRTLPGHSGTAIDGITQETGGFRFLVVVDSQRYEEGGLWNSYCYGDPRFVVHNESISMMQSVC